MPASSIETKPGPLPHNEPSLEAFLAAFEDGTLPKQRWTHAAHIFTGACYVHALGESAAIDRMRSRVSAYNLAVGGQNTPTSGYHETVTIFWIKLLASLYENGKALCPGESRSEFAHRAVRELASNREIYHEYYSYDVIASEEARRTWLPPDLRPLE
jgi:hypothetical protein